MRCDQESAGQDDGVRALVTGSAGFLGRHFAAALHQRGATVHEVDLRHPAAHRSQDVRDWFRQHPDAPYDLVVHCAAVVGGRTKIEGAPLDLAVDLAIDADLFGWALTARPGRVLYLSSSASYPTDLQQDREHRPLREDDVDLDAIRSPDHLYGWSKLTGEMLARHARAAGLPVTVVRPFSGYGADQDATYPFRAFVERARRRDQTFDVWGDGQQVRDFVHVSDIVGASLAACDAGLDGPLNIGWGRPTSFDELAHLVCRAAGYRPTLRHVGDAPQGVRWRVADTRRLADVWEPRVTLEEGVRRAMRGTEAAA